MTTVQSGKIYPRIHAVTLKEYIHFLYFYAIQNVCRPDTLLQKRAARISILVSQNLAFINISKYFFQFNSLHFRFIFFFCALRLSKSIEVSYFTIKNSACIIWFTFSAWQKWQIKSRRKGTKGRGQSFVITSQEYEYIDRVSELQYPGVFPTYKTQIILANLVLVLPILIH